MVFLSNGNDMLTFEQLKNDVGAWSQANFGNSPTRELPVETQLGPTPHSPDTTIACLGSVAPLLGMGEEIGELCEAHVKGSTELVRDSIGDILIYLADFCYREKFPFPTMRPPVSAYRAGSLFVLSAAYGGLCHAKLKRCQHIREMDKDDTYRTAIAGGMQSLLEALIDYAHPQYDVCIIANDTWTNVVSKRQWKLWSRTGVAVENAQTGIG